MDITLDITLMLNGADLELRRTNFMDESRFMGGTLNACADTIVDWVQAARLLDANATILIHRCPCSNCDGIAERKASQGG